MAERTPHILTSKMHIELIDGLRTYKNKSVATAARGFINLVKEVNPSLLNIYDKDQPKDFTVYGQVNVSEGLDGIDLYKKYEKIPEGKEKF